MHFICWHLLIFYVKICSFGHDLFDDILFYLIFIGTLWSQYLYFLMFVLVARKQTFFWGLSKGKGGDLWIRSPEGLRILTEDRGKQSFLLWIKLSFWPLHKERGSMDKVPGRNFFCWKLCPFDKPGVGLREPHWESWILMMLRFLVNSDHF